MAWGKSLLIVLKEQQGIQCDLNTVTPGREWGSQGAGVQMMQGLIGICDSFVFIMNELGSHCSVWAQKWHDLPLF